MADFATDENNSAATASAASSSNPTPRQLSQLRHGTVAHPQQQVTLTCYIPPSRVGAVIGRRGASILNIQREAARRSLGHGGSVRVSVIHGPDGGGISGPEGGLGNPNAPPVQIPHHAEYESTQPASATDGPVPRWTPVVIRADPVGAFAAARLLLPLIDHEMDNAVLDVPVHRSRHAAIIGRKGLTIAALSADHGVRIMVPNRDAGRMLGRMQAREAHAARAASVSAGSIAGGDEMLFGGSEGGTVAGAEAPQSPDTAAAAAAQQPFRLCRPTNVNIIQLEGELNSVEQCLVKVLAVVAGSPQQAKKEQQQQGGGEIMTSDATSDGNDRKGSGNKGGKNRQDKPANSASAAAAASTSGPGIAAQAKFAEATVTALPDISHLVPSLGRIRQIGRQTGTVIRRKKVSGGGGGSAAAAAAAVEGEAGLGGEDKNDEKDGGDDKIDKNSVGGSTHQLIISGKIDNVRSAVSILEKILGAGAGEAGNNFSSAIVEDGKAGGDNDMSTGGAAGGVGGGRSKRKQSRGGRKRNKGGGGGKDKQGAAGGGGGKGEGGGDKGFGPGSATEATQGGGGQ